MRLIIDRFEGKYAVCVQDDNIINVPRYKVPTEAKEGDCIGMENGFFVVKKEETNDRKSKMKRLMKDLKKKNRND